MSQTATRIEYNPSRETYQVLRAEQSGTLKCPCSRTAMPYSTILSLSPIFHQICSSDLVSDSWIQLIGRVRLANTVTEAWVNEGSRYFQYLATLCELASRQVNESVQGFLTRTVAMIDVLSEIEFSAQMNSTVAQLIKSILIRFQLFMQTSQGLTQIDQPLNQLRGAQIIFNRSDTMSGMINQPAPEVSIYRIFRISRQHIFIF